MTQEQDNEILIRELSERGLIEQHTAPLEEIFAPGATRTVYLGIDPTADSIHVGNLVTFMALLHLVRAGHTAIVLVGGGTALIGDPSGRDAERDFADADTVRNRAAQVAAQVEKLSGSADIRFVNNHDWLAQLSMLEFLRDVGKHFTVNAMIKKDSVSARLQSEQGISFTEFSYALLQSYDFLHLHQAYGCDMQIGGADQWGNISAGADFIRRKTGDAVYGLTQPLVVDAATGKKFGKSAGNAVWLDAHKTTPYDFYQFWLNVDDADAVKHLKMFTFVPLPDIKEIEGAHAAQPGARIAQKRLAYEVTALVHGGSIADQVVRVSALLFDGTPAVSFSQDDLALIASCGPVTQVGAPLSIVDALCASGLAESKREAREFVVAGAVSVNDEKVVDIGYTVDVSHPVVVRRGKRNVRVLTA